MLCMIQKTLEKNSNMFVVLRVIKQTWRWNYQLMNVSNYWSVIGKWRMLLVFNDVRGLNLVHHHELGELKEHGVRHKSTNTGGTERSDWTCHQWYSIINNPDGMSLCSMSFLGVYSGRRWAFWTLRAWGSLRNRSQHKLNFSLVLLLRNSVIKEFIQNLRQSVYIRT